MASPPLTNHYWRCPRESFSAKCWRPERENIIGRQYYYSKQKQATRKDIYIYIYMKIFHIFQPYPNTTEICRLFCLIFSDILRQSQSRSRSRSQSKQTCCCSGLACAGPGGNTSRAVLMTRYSGYSGYSIVAIV